MTKNDTSTSRRVFRGGCWMNSDAATMRARNRSGFDPSVRGNRLGVRCVLRGRQPR